MFRNVRDDHLKDEKLSSHLFYLLRLRSFLYTDDDPNCDSNNRIIFAALSQLPFHPEFSKKRAQDVQCMLRIFQTALSSRQFGVFFERQISSVDCHNFQSVSRLFAIFSGIDSGDEATQNLWNEVWRPMQYRVFNNLIGFLISSCSDASSSKKPQLQACPQPANDEFQAIFARVKVMNWNGSEVVFSFTSESDKIFFNSTVLAFKKLTTLTSRSFNFWATACESQKQLVNIKRKKTLPFFN
jgi:hypothetical protein